MGIWPGHRGYTPTLYEKCHGIFNDHRESGPRFNISSERRYNTLPVSLFAINCNLTTAKPLEISKIPLQFNILSVVRSC